MNENLFDEHMGDAREYLREFEVNGRLSIYNLAVKSFGNAIKNLEEALTDGVRGRTRIFIPSEELREYFSTIQDLYSSLAASSPHIRMPAGVDSK